MSTFHAGLQDVTALLWHFKGRQAALQVERQNLMRHMHMLRKQHFQHVVQQNVPAGVVSTLSLR